jgi:hypothetical protein
MSAERTIKDHQDLAAYLGASDDSEEAISRRVYKDTACGAWARLEEAIPTGIHSADTWQFDIKPQGDGFKPARVRREGDPDWIAPRDAPEHIFSVGPVHTYSGGYAPGVSFGSIVEGVEQTTSVHTVAYPCTEQDIDRALEAVEAEARDIWDLTHGCSYCHPDGMPGEDRDPEDTWLAGDTWVNPDCPRCKGEGIPI